jgi:hypothetical protein
MPPRPDALDVTDDGRPKATWSWYEALVVYFLAFLVAGLATVSASRLTSKPSSSISRVSGSVTASFAMSSP